MFTPTERGSTYLGLATFAGDGNTFDENDSRYNFDLDCLDDTGADTSSIANTWVNNIGWEDAPDGICLNLNDT